MLLNTKGSNSDAPEILKDLENKTHFFHWPFILGWVGQNHKKCLPVESFDKKIKAQVICLHWENTRCHHIFKNIFKLHQRRNRKIYEY